jgi:hypothetical protein
MTDLGRDVRQFTSLPRFDLLSHRLEVSLHAVDANRDAVDQRKRFRVFREHRGEHTTEGDVLIQIGIIAELGTAPRNPAGVDDDGSWSETWHRGPETGFEEVGRIGNDKSTCRKLCKRLRIGSRAICMKSGQ